VDVVFETVYLSTHMHAHTHTHTLAATVTCVDRWSHKRYKWSPL